MSFYARLYKKYANLAKVLKTKEPERAEKYEKKKQRMCKKMTTYSKWGWSKDCAGKVDKGDFMKRWFEQAPDCRKTIAPIQVTMPRPPNPPKRL